MSLLTMDAHATKIAWAHHTENFWWGCNEVSKECQGCYAKDIMTDKGRDFHIVRRTGDEQWRKPFRLNQLAAAEGKCALVFTCSMSDFFHDVADVWRPKAWEIIRDTPNLVWLILTKRPERIADHLPSDWGCHGYKNVWFGTTVGCPDSYSRLTTLREIPCALRFVSVEPLIESVADMDVSGYSWLLVGGMSGPLWKDKPMKLDWAADLYENVRHNRKISYFFKQSSNSRSERGIDGLGRHLGLKDKDGNYQIIRQIPKTHLPMMPLSMYKGHPFTDKQLAEYRMIEMNTGLVKIGPGTPSPLPVSSYKTAKKAS